jgi:hypothetical protein
MQLIRKTLIVLLIDTPHLIAADGDQSLTIRRRRRNQVGNPDSRTAPPNLPEHR